MKRPREIVDIVFEVGLDLVVRRVLGVLPKP